MSNETKWTPGPWFLSKKGNISNMVVATTGKWEFGDYSECICLFQSALGPGLHKLKEEEENAKANAHLIAAAPELHEALEDILKLHYCDVFTAGTWESAMEKSRAVLAKARGES